jgi:predicted site-specific integrase-resolvase
MGRPLEVYGTAEVAERLGVFKESVSRMIRKGKLQPDARLDCGPVFRKSTIDRYLKERQ